MSLFLHGGGFTGSGEQAIDGKVKLKLTSERVELYVSSVDMGQGAATVLTQITAQGLQIPFERVRYMSPDTSKAPDSGPTVASRTTMIVGKIVLQGAEKLIKRLKKYVSDSLDVPFEEVTYNKGFFQRNGVYVVDFLEAARSYEEKHGPLEVIGDYSHPAELYWDDDRCQGDCLLYTSPLLRSKLTLKQGL